jgi:MFS family permease
MSRAGSNALPEPLTADLLDPEEELAAEAALEEASVDGDVAVSPERLGVGKNGAKPGTARAALQARDFRVLWLAMFSSNVGTWMQNVALGAFAYKLSHSANFVALVGFAQLGPLLVLAPVGGLLADQVDRRKLLVLTNLEQLIFSAVLAWVAYSSHPSRGLILAVVLAIGIGNALTGPPMSSLMPNLVPRRDLSGAIALQSVQMNLSRVIGPAIGGLLLPAIKASGVFAVNAGTYLFAVAGVLMIHSVPQAKPATDQGWRRLLGGVSVARRDRLVREVLLTIAAISFFCLPFIGLMPVIAARDLHQNVTGLAYGLLYACFGLGAATGAIIVGSVLVGYRRDRVIIIGLAAFGAMLAVFGLLHSVVPAYPVVFGVGLFYFSTVTTLSTRLQEHLEDAVRGRVMALYMMAFGGTVPVGLLAAGPLVDATSVGTVLVIGAAVAGGLAVLAVLAARAR